MPMHQQKTKKSNAEEREPLGIERVERSNMLPFTTYMAEHTHGKGRVSAVLAPHEPASLSRQHCDEKS